MTADTLAERFTICITSDGKPVRRVLRTMTGGEVWRALQWHAAEAGRLEAMADQMPTAEALWDAYYAGELDEVEANARSVHAASVTQAATLAINRGCRLLQTVMATLPVNVPKGMRMIDALQRYWPAGDQEENPSVR